MVQQPNLAQHGNGLRERTKQAHEFSLRQSRTCRTAAHFPNHCLLGPLLIDFVPPWLQAYGNSRSRRLDVTNIPSILTRETRSVSDMSRI
jgi:hypothetical protein